MPDTNSFEKHMADVRRQEAIFAQHMVDSPDLIARLQQAYETGVKDGQLGNSRAVEVIKEAALRHMAENPTHGPGCACGDQLVREMRQILQVTPGPLGGGHDPKDAAWRGYRHWRHVLTLAMRW